MSVRRYLPSTQFIVIVVSLALSGGLVSAAQWYTSSQAVPPELASASDAALQADAAWQQNLEEIQAHSGVSLPDAPSQDTVQSLLANAQSGNLTDSVGRSLLVNLTTAGVQGLGDDIPTQNSIISQAAAQINASRPTTQAPALAAVDTTPITLRTYGNRMIEILGSHPKANSTDTLLAVGRAIDGHDSSQLAVLTGIGAEYRALARDLAAMEVPQTLTPLHAQVVKDITAIADTFADLKTSVDDPLRGLAGLQNYQSLMSETGRVFINIAESLQKSGILFSKGEAGAAWSTFLSP